MLEKFFIVNNVEIAKLAEDAGIERIWIDIEKNGKEERQRNLDTVKSNHCLEDILAMKKNLTKAKVMVRINPYYEGTKFEVDTAVNYGADVIMLPMFRSAQEVSRFIDIVNHRAKCSLLLETKEAKDNIDSVLMLNGIDEIHIGLNDLHLAYNLVFMFQLLSNGVVEELIDKIRGKGVSCGFGGVAKLGHGLLKAEYILAEHYRLGSSQVILSRAFCDPSQYSLREVKQMLEDETKKVMNYEKALEKKPLEFFQVQHDEMCQIIENIIKEKNKE